MYLLVSTFLRFNPISAKKTFFIHSTHDNMNYKYSIVQQSYSESLQINSNPNPLDSISILNHNVLLTSIISIRAGGGKGEEDEYDDDEYDQYDDREDEDDDEYHKRQPQRQSPIPSRQSPPSHHNRHHQRRHHHQIPSDPRGQRQRQQPPPPPHPHSRKRPPPSSSSRQQRRKSSLPSPTSNILKSTTDIAQKSLNLATSATISTLKTTGRAAYYLTAPKYVSKEDIFGIWRFDQSIGTSVCAATIEFTPNGNVITRFSHANDKDSNDSNNIEEEKITGYLFQSKSWPKSCSIEFEAEAFQGSDDERPVKYYYKGYFRRKMADKSVIKIVGKIYEVKQRFWGRSKKGIGGGDMPGIPGVEVGSFVARKRLQKKNDWDNREYDLDDDVYDEDYDDYYDDDEYDVEEQ